MGPCSITERSWLRSHRRVRVVAAPQQSRHDRPEAVGPPVSGRERGVARVVADHGSGHTPRSYSSLDAGSLQTVAPAARAAVSNSWSRIRREIESPVGRNGWWPARANFPCAVAPRGPVTFIPSSGNAPARSRISTTPRRARMRTASGLMYSEHALSRGNAARSTRRTENPARASRVAVALPAGPAPATSTSTSPPLSGDRRCSRSTATANATPPFASEPAERVATKFTYPSLFTMPCHLLDGRGATSVDPHSLATSQAGQ